METAAAPAATETPSIPLGRIVPPAGVLSELETLRKNVDMYNWLKNNIKGEVMDEYYASRRGPIYVSGSSSSNSDSSFWDILIYVAIGAAWGIAIYKLVLDQKAKRTVIN